MMTFREQRKANWVQAHQDALTVVEDMAIRLAQNVEIPENANITKFIKDAIQELEGILIDERHSPVDRRIHEKLRPDRVRHLTFSICKLLSAMSLLAPARITKGKK